MVDFKKKIKNHRKPINESKLEHALGPINTSLTNWRLHDLFEVSNTGLFPYKPDLSVENPVCLKRLILDFTPTDLN